MKLHYRVFVALGLGILFGWFYPSMATNISFIGDIFTRLLRFLIVPLVFASLLTGVVSLKNMSDLGKLGFHSAVYFILSTVIAISFGLLSAFFIQPGLNSVVEPVTQSTISQQAPPSIHYILTSIVPKNLFDAIVQGNMLPIIFSSVFFGIGLLKINELGRPVIDFFESINTLMIQLTKWIIEISPIGVFALIANLTATTGIATLKPLGLYIITVLFGLCMHAGLFLPIVVYIATRKSCVTLFKSMTSALATAFSAASSAAALPMVLELIVEKAKVPNRVASFVLPLGTTLNMNGTALYQAVAVIFIAQFYGIEIGIHHISLIFLTGVLAAVGAAAIPSAGLFTLGMILTTTGVPLEGVALIIAVDRVVDMCRTTVNVWANSVGAYIIAHTSQQT